MLGIPFCLSVASKENRGDNVSLAHIAHAALSDAARDGNTDKRGYADYLSESYLSLI